MYTLKADRFICRLSHGGGGREKCPTPCKKGGGIVRAGEMPGGIYLRGKCPGEMSCTLDLYMFELGLILDTWIQMLFSFSLEFIRRI